MAVAPPVELPPPSKPLSWRLQVSEKDFASIGPSDDRFNPTRPRSRDSAGPAFTLQRLDIPRPYTSASDISPRASVSTFSSIQSSFSKLTSDSLFSRRPLSGSQASAITLDSHYENTPTLVKTPWELERAKKPKGWNGRPKPPLPERFFEQMPQGVYECVLRQLEDAHMGRSTACSVCYVKDLYNLSLTSKSWHRAARQHMYKKLWVPAESRTHAGRRQRIPEPAERLKLLLRTLRQDLQLARTIKELQVADWLQVYEFAEYEERNEIVESLSALVHSCSNLERLTGFYTVYNHELDALTQALSSRTRLKERMWIIRDDRALTRQVTLGEDGDSDGDWKLNYADKFMQRHINWASLETLALFGHDGLTGMDYRAFVGTLRKLHCLKRLSIATFPLEEFDDRTLQAIPGVQSLRLQSLPGVTDKGLGRWVNSEPARQVRSLTLIDLEVTSLTVIAKVFSRMTQLRRFTLSQDCSPSLPPGAVLPHPFLASPTLQFLHWDTLVPGHATVDLAGCIDSGAFPSLRTIRSPTDYKGHLQELCRPVAQITHDTDNFLVSLMKEGVASETHYSRALPEARRQAQARLEQAQNRPFIKILVDEEGVLQHTYTMRGFMGKVGSKIEYSLEPDIEGSRDAIVNLVDLISSKQTRLHERVCTGPAKARDAEDKRVWSHRPRRRGRSLELKQMF